MGELKLVKHDGLVVADSREVAEMISVRHADLLERIDGYVRVLSQNGEFRSDDFFLEGAYTAGTGREYKMYYLTRKGCDMVANKTTGEKGILFTAAYATKFEEMENALAQVGRPSYMIEDPIARAEKWIEEERRRRTLETERLMLTQQISELQPKASYVDQILQSTGTVTVSQIAKDYGLSAKALNSLLHETGVQYKVNGQWLLYSKHQDCGYTKSRTVEYFDSVGERRVKMDTQWTQKGRLFIHEILGKRGIVPYMDREHAEVAVKS